jgi:hypothetical protein
MYPAKNIFEVARDKGDEYILICMKRQQNAEPLVIYRSGTRDDMLTAQAEFCSTGGGWGFAYVGMFNTAEPWEEHEAYLRTFGF